MRLPRALDKGYVNRRAILPYGFTVEEVERAVAETYRLFHGLNDYLRQSGFRPLEELLLGNSLSGIISEFLVKNIAKSSLTLESNTKCRWTPRPPPEKLLYVERCFEGRSGDRGQMLYPERWLARAQSRGVLVNGFSVRCRQAEEWRNSSFYFCRNPLRRTDKSRLVFLWTERGLTPDSDGLNYNRWR